MTKNSKDIVITSALRSPIGSYKGALKEVKADQLGTICIKETLSRSNLRPEEIDEIVLGQILTSGEGQNPARQASINAGIPNTTPAHIVNQLCGSGLRAIISGYQLLMLDDANIVITGGQENMSRSPHTILYRLDKKLDKNKLVDSMINDGLMDAFNNYHMGVTAENVARKFNITREQQDEFALDSQKKASLANSQKRFDDEIININLNSNKKIVLDKDEYPKKNISIEDLKKLKAIFEENGTVTSGNSSGLNDAAAIVVLMKRGTAEKKNQKIFAKIKSWANSGVDPSIMGIGPIPATKLALKKAGWKIEDIDLFEINEAFAAQSLAVIKELNIQKEKVNVNGGAIALGHPIGASGARILVTLLHEMEKRNLKKGLATLCVGGGMGIALCLERD
jgi:acetyl-CoA C-acetyltransferase